MNTALTTDLMTVRQVALLFRLGERSVLSRIKDGRLPAHKMEGGKQWLIRRADALAVLQGHPASQGVSSPKTRPGVMPAGTDSMDIDPGAGIIRRTHTPEGRARALAALDRLLDGDADEQRRAWEHLQSVGPESAIQFRRWDVETGERLDEEGMDEEAEGR